MEDTAPITDHHTSSRTRSALAWLVAVFDSSVLPDGGRTDGKVEWGRFLPFVTMHVACIAVLWVGASTPAVILAAALYGVRMFAITAFYHR